MDSVEIQIKFIVFSSGSNHLELVVAVANKKYIFSLSFIIIV